MLDDKQVQTNSFKPREPSLPEGAYRLMHLLGAYRHAGDDFESLLELHTAIRNGDVTAAPSRLTEMVQRVLYSAGLSNMDEQQMANFLKECSEADL